jgi:hypothetical protein
VVVSEDPRPDDDLDAELEQLSAEALRIETIDPETGERRLEGFVTRGDSARGGHARAARDASSRLRSSRA